jgi:hypothetical protein
LTPGPWDLLVDGVLVELDEQMHFNRYRTVTLELAAYRELPRFPRAAYREFCSSRETECRRHGWSSGAWTDPSSERHFGAPRPQGELRGAGSPRWKQRAVYDAMKDLTSLVSAAPFRRWVASPSGKRRLRRPQP